MSLIFSTNYYIDGRPFGGEIEADDLQHAQMLAIQRGLNEVIDSQGSKRATSLGGLRGYMANRQWDQAVHEATFLGFVGLTSGALTVREVMGDRGLIHEIAHFMEFQDAGDPIEGFEATYERLMTLAKDFETRVPGWPRQAIEEAMRREMPIQAKELRERAAQEAAEASELVPPTEPAEHITQDPPAPGKAAQGVYMDQVDAVVAAETWFEAIQRTVKGPTSIDRTHFFNGGGVLTLWCSSILLASAVLIRDDMNYTVLSLIEHSNA